MKKLITTFLISLSASAAISASDKPNIVWITSEDNSAMYMNYMNMGNGNLLNTPNMDNLAKKGIVYERAYSNGAVCAVARNTIITGMYAASLGTFNHRSVYPAPDFVHLYPKYLKEVGYYCTNNDKEDYNVDIDSKLYWDESSKKAHFKNRPSKDTPYFAIFNSNLTHEHTVFPDKIAQYREKGTIPQTPATDPKAVRVPDYLPDTPAIRNEQAIYFDYLNAYDKFLKGILDDIEADGTADNTIVFYYSDHGGPLARGKRWLEDSGTHVPFIVYLPKKWEHLSKVKPGGRNSDIIAFVDLAPTIISLAGGKIPSHMQGQPFLGADAKKDKEAFLYNGRFDESAMIVARRALTDGENRYIRDFYSFTPQIIPCLYQFGHLGWQSWQKEALEGRANRQQTAVWENGKVADFFYNTVKDPYEINNLADKNSAEMKDLKARCIAKMKEIKDAVILPEIFYYDIPKGSNVYDYLRSDAFDYDAIFDLAWKSGDRDEKNLPEFAKLLNSDDPVKTHWALVGMACLGDKSAVYKEQLKSLILDEKKHIGTRILASIAHDLATKDDDGLKFLTEYSKDVAAIGKEISGKEFAVFYANAAKCFLLGKNPTDGYTNGYRRFMLSSK